MSIEKLYSKFVAVCDCCGDELPPEDTFGDAVEAKKAEGWKNQKYGEDWVDTCPECQGLEESE